ncbi:somatotropin [Aplochiton taeniatus]
MDKVCVLVAALLATSLVQQGATLSDNQRLLNIAVNRAQHLHMVAQKMFTEFESALQNEDQRQMNKIFLQDFCNSDYIISPMDKHEAQRSSELKLLRISYRLIESWELPCRSLASSSLAVRNHISEKLTDLKMGISLLIKGSSSDHDNEAESLLQAPYGNYYQALAGEGTLRRTYELLACFKKDMHKVETYLTLVKCRNSLEVNCTD